MSMDNREILSAICEGAFSKYLTCTLKSPLSQGRSEEICMLFHEHMTQVGLYIYDNFFMRKWVITEEYIQGLHKICYPSWYSESKKIIWGSALTLVPWKYKFHSQNFGKFVSVEPWKVRTEMHEIIKYFNIHNSHDASIASKKQALLLFIFKFLCIHPFANANGRVASILLDSGLIYLGYTPIKFKEKYDAEKIFALNIQKSIRENSFEKFLIAFND